MAHGGISDCTITVFLMRRIPDHIAFPDTLNRITPALDKTCARCDDQKLTQGVGVPGCSRSRLEHHIGAIKMGWFLGLERGVDTDGTRKLIVRAFSAINGCKREALWL
jgi:hypothetical protein